MQQSKSLPAPQCLLSSCEPQYTCYFLHIFLLRHQLATEIIIGRIEILVMSWKMPFHCIVLIGLSFAFGDKENVESKEGGDKLVLDDAERGEG